MTFPALFIAAFFSVCCLTLNGLAEETESAFKKEIRPLLEKYCVDCHDSSGKAKGDVDLAQFDEESAFWKNPKLWERVLVQLRDKVMPPAKKKQPADEERAQLAAWVSQTLEHPDLSKAPKDPGRQGIHRLSRLEYNNTLRDLLGIDTHPADQFPPDSGGGGGFDNNADTLFIPPVLIEKYFEAAADALAAARPDRLFDSRPTPELDESSAARESLSRFATRGFRRPVLDEELARLMRCYDAARQRGESWEDAVRLSCRAVLVSSQFLFRMEPEREGAAEPYPAGAYELASRLSYFLWSSMPDEELLRVAGEGNLQEPSVLEAQVSRMLADPKSRALAENFASQWLRTKELRTVVEPARDKFPQFTPELREAFYAEPVEFFHALLGKNEALTDCLDADYTFVNETLAKFYGIEGVAGGEMRRVALTDKNRGGILGMAGVLTLTSYPRRTSPVLRGKWVMEEVLGTPPPPPPPLVNTQKVGNERSQDGLTFRQRLEEHRADMRCAGCHARMDPLGFGLENFDALGAWRTASGGSPVDASGQLVTGEKFTGPIELKRLLMARKDEFIRALAERMLSYALGRGIEPYDWVAVRGISSAVAADNYRAQRLVLEIVRSFPFQYRRPRASQNVAHSSPQP